MAEKRCFSMSIVDSDAFMEMPLSTQCFYFHLGMRADDYGFVNNPRRIAKLVGASDDDFKLLVSKRFLLLFDNGVVVIKHWLMHNNIRKERLKNPQYPDIAGKLYIKENRSYTDTPRDGLLSLSDMLASKQLSDQCQPNDTPLSYQCQHKRKEEKRREKKIKEQNTSPSSIDDVEEETRARENESFEEEKQLKKFGGSNFEGLNLSEEQLDDLTEKLSLDELNYYGKKLSDWKMKYPNRLCKSDYKIILKWAREDRETEGGYGQRNA